MTTNVIETFLQNGGGKIQTIDGADTPVVVFAASQKLESLDPFQGAETHNRAPQVR